MANVRCLIKTTLEEPEIMSKAKTKSSTMVKKNRGTADGPRPLRNGQATLPNGAVSADDDDDRGPTPAEVDPGGHADSSAAPEVDPDATHGITGW
jgi:hypothetical protein